MLGTGRYLLSPHRPAATVDGCLDEPEVYLAEVINVSQRDVLLVLMGAIARVTPISLLLDNGAELPACEIVFATGHRIMLETTKNIAGAEFAGLPHEVWGADAGEELRSIWRRSGHPASQFAGGIVAPWRYYPRLPALQIKAIEEGIVDCF
ncbi:putative FAD/NAD(P)-binding domain-containing protein [Seiridium cardinale]